MLTTETLDLLQSLGVALGIGLLLGLERGWHERAAPDGQRVAGIRTFGLLSLAGALTGLLAQHWGSWVFAAGMLGVVGLLLAGYRAAQRRDPSVGMTTEVAGWVAFMLGALVIVGQGMVAVAVAVVVMVLLGSKARVHRGVTLLSEQELFALFQLLVLALVVLPLLPDRGMGPWQALNPRVIGWLVLLLAGLSFIGYFAIRVLGARRGLLLTAVFGGLVSSTALTVLFARQALSHRAWVPVLAVGIVLASATLFPRVWLEVGVVNPLLAAELFLPMLAMMLAAYAGAFLLWRRSGQNQPDAPIEPVLANPLELKAALKFAALLVAIMVAAQALQQQVGSAGVFGLAAVSGLVDVDALSLSMAQMQAAGQVPLWVAERAIMLTVWVNTASKMGLALLIGGRALGVTVAWVLIPATLLGMGVMVLFALH
ncbi:MgtC/SapB family protein [Halothiobacillus sp. DCM-1]|uniref:MgtC/SapB family protein n=1 Tax=Halothiobacillus sp. DCM-1 TaxID=3112558 RepID=UPI003245F3A4